MSLKEYTRVPREDLHTSAVMKYNNNRKRETNLYCVKHKLAYINHTINTTMVLSFKHYHIQSTQRSF